MGLKGNAGQGLDLEQGHPEDTGPLRGKTVHVHADNDSGVQREKSLLHLPVVPYVGKMAIP